jgi:hypothetical protein
MERREFIVKSGTVLSAAVFFSKFGLVNTLVHSSPTTDHSKRPDPARFQQPILKVIALGVNAPSPHNTQSWKFEIVNDTHMLLYVDENILLPATDPPSRQIHMGAGCFIETAVLALSGLATSQKLTTSPRAIVMKMTLGANRLLRLSLSKKSLKLTYLPNTSKAVRQIGDPIREP